MRGFAAFCALAVALGRGAVTRAAVHARGGPEPIELGLEDAAIVEATTMMLASGPTDSLAGFSSNDATVSGSDAGPTGADDGGAPADGAAVDAAPSDPSAIPPPSACPAATYKTLVIVGDSISDVGGGGSAEEVPFYRTLLVSNDDAISPRAGVSLRRT